MPPDEPRQVHPVLGAVIDVLTWDEALQRIEAWADRNESRYVCICNAHSAVTASRDQAFRAAIAGADMATPDGAPVAWMLRRLGFAGQERINGPDLMWRLCARAATSGRAIYLMGSTDHTLAALQIRLGAQWPTLKIAGARSPPFRQLTMDEERELVDDVNRSGAGLVFVSLGCPKQELWMAKNQARLTGVMIGVGAAFDFHAGTVRRAPDWMRRRGLEWLHRLCSEPRQLWRRYLITNSAFMVGAALQLLANR